MRSRTLATGTFRARPSSTTTAYPTPSIAEYARGSGVDGFLVASSTPARRRQDALLGRLPGRRRRHHRRLRQGDFTAFTKNGGTPILSFGGASNAPLETSETDIAGIVAQYQGVIDNYQTKHLDFAFEGAILGDDAARTGTRPPSASSSRTTRD
ncbi:hypothetical protein ACFH04_42095 [Streptomyces noboritoensis]|uniref:Luciferase-like domain-containing protein n=1 Tax=Streptomyces noboritoensis TaxID=67337 RepID=A0ABV6TWR2_9ACTN